MKLFTFLVFFAVSAAAIASPMQSVPDTQPDEGAKEAVGRLTDLRAQITRLESPIIHAYLARAGLGARADLEGNYVIEILNSKGDVYHQPDPEVAKWLSTEYGKIFTFAGPFPPGIFYESPVVLPRNAVLDKPVKGKGIFPTGRRPQDPKTLLSFVNEAIHELPRDKSLDPASAALLDVSLLRLLSARILLGYEIGLAKFKFDNRAFCSALAQGDDAERVVTELVTDHKQEVKVLGRVREKAKAFIGSDPNYTKTAADQILRLFQAYLIPITTKVEVQTILGQYKECKKVRQPL